MVQQRSLAATCGVAAAYTGALAAALLRRLRDLRRRLALVRERPVTGMRRWHRCWLLLCSPLHMYPAAVPLPNSLPHRSGTAPASNS